MYKYILYIYLLTLQLCKITFLPCEDFAIFGFIPTFFGLSVVRELVL
jgi:hypothetical protein